MISDGGSTRYLGVRSFLGEADEYFKLSKVWLLGESSQDLGSEVKFKFESAMVDMLAVLLWQLKLWRCLTKDLLYL